MRWRLEGREGQLRMTFEDFVQRIIRLPAGAAVRNALHLKRPCGGGPRSGRAGAMAGCRPQAGASPGEKAAPSFDGQLPRAILGQSQREGETGNGPHLSSMKSQLVSGRSMTARARDPEQDGSGLEAIE